MISITQIDIALISLLVGEIISLFTIRFLLNDKEFPMQEPDLEKTEDTQCIIEKKSLISLLVGKIISLFTIPFLSNAKEFPNQEPDLEKGEGIQCIIEKESLI